MELRHLRYFLAVAEEGHFGRAAERVHIVQSALSMQIRALEEELGGPLFVRTSRQVRLTEAGEAFREQARRTLEQAEHARLTVQRSLRGETGRVRVGFAGNAVFSGKLMSDLRAFHAAYPDAELVVEEVAPSRQGEALLAGQLDIGYTPAQVVGEAVPLRLDAVGRWPLLMAMERSHRLAGEPLLTAAMLHDEPMILYAADPHDRSLEACLREALGGSLKVAHRAGNSLTVLALAAAGLGLALVPEPLVQVALAQLVYKPLAIAGMHTELSMLSRPDETSGAVQAYLALARAQG